MKGLGVGSMRSEFALNCRQTERRVEGKEITPFNRWLMLRFRLASDLRPLDDELQLELEEMLEPIGRNGFTKLPCTRKQFICASWGNTPCMSWIMKLPFAPPGSTFHNHMVSVFKGDWAIWPTNPAGAACAVNPSQIFSHNPLVFLEGIFCLS